MSELETMRAERDDLAARVAELEKDAARWRAFRSLIADKPLVTESDVDAECDLLISRLSLADGGKHG